MTDKKVNIDKLKNEIETRKREKTTQSTNLGESVNTGGNMPRDTFLNGLLQSLDHGTETSASSRLKMVENAVDSKEGLQPRYQVNENQTNTQPKPQPRQNPVQPSQNELSYNERDELMYKEFEKQTSQTLGESLSNYDNNQRRTNNVQQPQQQSGQVMNEQYISEVVQKTLENNFEAIVETAMKNVVFDIFASEKLKEGLSENRDSIKKIVYETIRELQNKKKK